MICGITRPRSGNNPPWADGAAPDGESALEIYAANKGIIDLVLLDLGMGGAKCLDLLIRMDPLAKVVIASGYTEDGLVKDSLLQEAKASILKPYTIETLLPVIRKVLNGLWA